VGGARANQSVLARSPLDMQSRVLAVVLAAAVVVSVAHYATASIVEGANDGEYATHYQDSTALSF